MISGRGPAKKRKNRGSYLGGGKKGKRARRRGDLSHCMTGKGLLNKGSEKKRSGTILVGTERVRQEKESPGEKKKETPVDFLRKKEGKAPSREKKKRPSPMSCRGSKRRKDD